ncbi:MFS transporter [Streptomyces sp. NBRC 109706]|uniref:MFS transporter n=1 Tax=Streptomyces sp. NBRC 109706 TaxID=1550035 RepID=UPI0007821C0C|nr:MFS transporter [Streptomyces sp. NBRC 109706]
MHTLRATRTLPPAVQLLLVNQFGVNTGFYLLIPYLAFHLDEGLGMSAAAVGLVLGARNLSQQGLFLIGGSAADRLGPRRVIIAGCALRTVGFGAFALGDSLAVLLVASLLSGLAGALFNPAVRAYVAVSAGERRAEAFALFQVFATTGALVGPVLGSVLLLVDFRASALAAAGIFAVLTVAQALVLPAAPGTAPSAARPGVLSDWRQVLTNRAFLAFSLAFSGLFALETQLYLLFPQGARVATDVPGAAGAVFLLGTVLGLTLQLRLTTRLKAGGDRGRALVAGLLLMALAFLPPLLVTAAPAGDPPAGVGQAALRLLPVLVGALLLYLGLMVAQPFVLELIPAFGQQRLTGTHFGVFYAISGLVAAGVNALVGWTTDLGERSGLPALPWLCCLLIGLLSAGGALLLRRADVLPGPAPAPSASAAPAGSAPTRRGAS